MNDDMSLLHDVFFDEASEHLENLERIMLSLDVDSPSQEGLGAIFRAAHSIKGGSGTFGFLEMAKFTHVLESLLDKVRTAEIQLTETLVDLILRAGDVLRGQVKHYRDHEPLDPALAAALVTELQSALDLGVEALEKSNALRGPDSRSQNAQLRITYTCRQPDDRRASQREDVRSTLESIGTLGATDDDLASPSWTYDLLTTGDEAVVRSLFMFVLTEPDELEVVVTAGSVPPALAAPAAIGNSGFGDDEPQMERPTPVHEAAHAPAGRPKSADSGTIRVNLDKVDALINLVGEMVISQAMLAQAADRADGTSEEMRAAIDQITRHTRVLRESVMSIRMVPMSFVFSRSRAWSAIRRRGWARW
jgi:two-component system chemotaxis sensor kinase CheA